MRKFVFFLLFAALVLFCTTTVYLYQHRGNAVCLKGMPRRTLQPVADVWYNETREVIDFYQNFYEKNRQKLNAYCEKKRGELKKKSDLGYHNAYSRMTNTLIRAKQPTGTQSPPD